MAATLRELIVKISADSSVYQREMNRATRMGSEYYRSMESGSRRVQAAMRRQQEGLREFNSRLEAVKSQAVSVGGVLAAAFAAQNVIRLADGWNQVSARLKQASDGSQDFKRNQEAIFDLSQRTGTAYADNANLFARSAASMREFGYSSRDVLAVTEALATGLQLSGADAADSSAVIRQFTQALGKGILNGEEFNTVNESGDRVIRALAEGMGIARSDMKALADQQQLTIDRVVPALISQLGKLREEFLELPGSVGRSMTRVSNAFQKWTAGQDGATGSTQALAASIDTLASNMDKAAGAAVVLIAGGLSKYLTGVGSSALDAARDVLAAQAAQINLTKAQALAAAQAAQTAETDRLRAAAALESAKAQVESARQEIAAKRQSQVATLDSLKATQATMAVERELEAQRLRAQYTDVGRQKSLARMAELRTSEVAITRQVQAAEQALASTTVASSKVLEAAYAQRATAAAAAADTTKKANLASAASEQATAKVVSAGNAASRFARWGGVALGLLGGPAGMITLAAMAGTSWLMFRDGVDEASEKLIDIGVPLDNTISKFKELTESQRTLQMLQWGKDAKREAESAADAFDSLLTQMRYGRQDLAADNGGVLPLDTASSYDAYVEQLKAAQASGKSLIPVLTEMQERFGLPGLTLERWVKLAATIDSHNQKLEALTERQRKAQAAIDATTGSVGEQGQTFNQATVGAQKYLEKLQEKLAKAVDPTALAAAKRELETLGKDVDPSVAAKVLEVAAGIDKQKKAAEAAKKAEQAREKALKASQRAAEKLAQSYKDTFAGLDQQIRLSGRATELDQLQYELQHGKLKLLDDEQKQRLRNKAAQLDELVALGEYQDMLGSLLSDEEQLTQLTRDRLATLQRATSITENQREVTRERILKRSVSEAPDYGGLDPSVGGPSAELIRVAEADGALTKWRKDELQRQKEFLNEKLINEDEYKKQLVAIEEETTTRRQELQRAYASTALGITSQMAGDIAALMEQMGDRSSTAYKVMFGISKAASIAQSIVNVETAYTKALAIDPTSSLAGWVRGLGYASIGITASTAIAGMAHDGIDTIPKDGTWLLQKGERVVDSRTNADLKQYLRGGGERPGGGEADVTVNVNIYGDTGRSDVEAPTGMESMGRELKAVVDRHITARLQQEQRAGGLLYRAGGRR